MSTRLKKNPILQNSHCTYPFSNLCSVQRRWVNHQEGSRQEQKQWTQTNIYEWTLAVLCGTLLFSEITQLNQLRLSWVCSMHQPGMFSHCILSPELFRTSCHPAKHNISCAFQNWHKRTDRTRFKFAEYFSPALVTRCLIFGINRTGPETWPPERSAVLTSEITQARPTWPHECWQDQNRRCQREEKQLYCLPTTRPTNLEVNNLMNPPKQYHLILCLDCLCSKNWRLWAK